jgi:enamine deaminase RidA (YjgF/YER057c/UK114 family)
MCAISSAAREREQVAKLPRGRALPTGSRMVLTGTGSDPKAGAQHSHVDLGDSARAALMITPQRRGVFRDQAREVLGAMQTVFDHQPEPMAVTVLTVFLKSFRDQPACEQLLADFFNSKPPVTNYVLQPPCSGAALAVEAWAIGGESVRVERFGPHALSVAYDGVRWVYCAGLKPRPAARGVYEQTLDVLKQSRAALAGAGSGFERVVRTWFYLGGITKPEAEAQRYQELNRARTDFYHDIPFHCSALAPNVTRGVYPASTGIGMAGRGLVMSCMTLETQRDDLCLLPLENPQQTPAYAYHPKYSPLSPKFSRAVALLLGDYVTTWVSGTASIVDSETRHPGDPAKQTEQTIQNIERLIAPENFGLHGLKGAGAGLHDLAKIRVYLKRPEDLPKCKAVCERRFGAIPAIYAVADICRPDLLVEIEGVAFSRYSPAKATPLVDAGGPSAKAER